MTLPVALFSQGPAGGKGGQPYSGLSSAQVGGSSIRYVKIRYDLIIHSIEIGYSDPPVPVKYGGTGGTRELLKIFQPGEYINQLSGSYGDALASLAFTTNLSGSTLFAAVSPAGMPSSFKYEAPPSFEIIGVFGNAGTSINTVGVWLRAHGQ
jgi:hypothetical protein